MSGTGQKARHPVVYAASDPLAIPEALWALRDGLVVVLPTDTVYGVGCDLWQPEAIENLYRAKQRPKRLPIPVLVSSPDHVREVATDTSPLFQLVAQRFWPGGLTVILPRRPYVPDVLCSGGDTIAVRMPDDSFALRLIAEMGGALAVTSANLSGLPEAITVEEALADLDGHIAVAIDGGKCPGGVASSIVDLVSDPPALLREGSIGAGAIQEVLPRLVRPASA